MCELNYTPQKDDGTIDCRKAIAINEAFETSRQFWAWLVEQKIVETGFINSVPHMSFVWGDTDVAYLKKRQEALTRYYPFKAMQYSEDHAQLKRWMPIVMEGRDPLQKVAATCMAIGTDVNFGALTRALVMHLQNMEGVSLHLKHEVRSIGKEANGHWNMGVKDIVLKETRTVSAKFVFIGAGGGSLSLPEKFDIVEGKGLAGSP